jgi:tryptophanyl-tRNA synthetase
VSNLLNIFSACSGDSVESLVARYQGKGYGDFKKDVAEAVIAKLAPIQERIQNYLSDPTELQSILKSGAEKARALATPKLQLVKSRLGLGQ